jgi:hypothetical protein
MKTQLFINRRLAARIQQRMFKGKAIVVYGPRQSGKTTLIHSILSKYKDETIEFNGDESDIRELLSDNNSTRLKLMIGKKRIVFIDEAQRIPNIGITLKLIHDQLKDIQLIATGSSSFELASETSESLTGRKFEFLLLPLSFQELMETYGLLAEKRMLEHRLIFGHYPDIVISQNDAKELIKLLADSYLYKDILTIESIKKPLLLEQILKALSFQVGSEVSFREIGQLVGANSQTVERYIALLEKAFVIFHLPAFSRNLRNEIKRGKKIYFYDNGIRNAVINNFSPITNRNDIGALWENYLISERMKCFRFENINANRYFWRTTQQQEIDYLEEQDGKLFAYEFKWNPKKAKKRFPKTFINAYNDAVIQVITSLNFDEFLMNC